MHVKIVRYACAGCRATWRVLPAFIARHLWRRWTTVARAIVGNPGASMMPVVPARTRRRWKNRLASAARQIAHLLSQHDESVAKLARVLGFDATRRDLVELFVAVRALGVHALEDIAATLHVLEPGIRLM